MKIDRVTFIKTFQVGLSNWEKVGMEASIDDFENPKESLEILKKEVEDFHRSSNPQLYKNGNEALVNGYYSSGNPIGIGTYINEPKVINRLYDNIRDQIGECQSIEELAKLKPGLPVDLMPDYMNKLKSLTSKIS